MDVAQRSGMRRKPDRLGIMSDRSDMCQAFEKIGLLGLFGSELLSNAFTDFKGLLWSVWDSQF